MSTLRTLANRFSCDPQPLEQVAKRYPFRLSDYYASLIQYEGDPIWLQAIPSPDELSDTIQQPDPLDEERLSPVPGLIHRYPDRVVLLTTNCCAVYCRFCMRKRFVGQSEQIPCSLDSIREYLQSHTEIRDLLLSGGDPLLLPLERLGSILEMVRSIPHIEIIRIGSRLPVTDPERITPELCRLLSQYHPLFLNTHFNHSLELTPDAAGACQRLLERGVVLGNQTVLLKGVNDTAQDIEQLNRGLLTMRVRPYYLHQMDLVQGTRHFRTPLASGLHIIDRLRGRLSGLGIPHFMLDLPGGKGKLALQRGVGRQEGSEWVFTNWEGEEVRYPDLPHE
ncbi:MAG: KamA family radical SAM protein [Trichlorobacter sp.]